MGTEASSCKTRSDSASTDSVSTECPSSRTSITEDIDGLIKPLNSINASLMGNDSDSLQDKYWLLSGRTGFKILGAGEFGNVYEGFSIDGTRVAVKMLDEKKDKKQAEHSQRLFDHEVQVLRRVADHRNVLRCLNVVYSNGGAHALVTELCDGGDLWSYVDRRRGICEGKARHWFGQLVDGVEYIHRNGVVHLDLKTENIGIVGDHTLKIMDFGLSQTCAVYSQTLEPVRFKRRIGTPSCMAPEVVMMDYCGPEADIWGLGAILYEMLTGRYPFEAENERQQTAKILEGRYCSKFPKFQLLTREVRSLLRGLFTLQPEKRCTLHEARECAWMKNATRKRSNANYNSVWATMPQRIDIVEDTASMSVNPIRSQFDVCGCTRGMAELCRDVEKWLVIRWSR